MYNVMMIVTAQIYVVLFRQGPYYIQSFIQTGAGKWDVATAAESLYIHTGQCGWSALPMDNQSTLGW